MSDQGVSPANGTPARKPRRPRTSGQGTTGKARTATQTAEPAPVDPTPQIPAQRGSAAFAWTLDTGEILKVEPGNRLRLRVHGALTFAHGELFTQEREPVTVDGRPLTVTAFRQPSRSRRSDPPGTEAVFDSGTVAKVLWEGRITAADSRLAYEITADRVIDPESGVRTAMVTTIDRAGNVRTRPLALGITRKAQELAWLDTFGIIAVESPAMVGKYIRALVDGLPDSGSAIYGQGPLYTADGTLMLATASGCYDTEGEPVTGWSVDLSEMNPVYLRDMHDVLPQRDPDMVRDGIGRLISLLKVSADYPEVPAAHLGQLLVSVLAPIDARFFTAIWLHSLKGTGKTRFEALVSAIQSPRLRVLDQVKPELNLGDVTGTTKGPKYRVTAFALGTILGDDVFKAVHTPQEQMKRTEMADAMIRSYEGGAAAIGHVDKLRNRVTSKASGQLSTSIRITAEGPPPTRAGAQSSTADRMIVQGGWVCPWDQVFDRGQIKGLSASAALDAMYAAYSEITLWVWSHRAEVNTLYADAAEITAGWVMGSERVRSRYTPVVAGLLVLRNEAVKRGYSADCVDDAIKGLQLAAVRQTAPESVPDLATEFRSELRLALREGSIAAVGRPVRSTGENQGAYISPYRTVDNPEDEDLKTWVWPDGVDHESDLGLKIDGANARPKRDTAIEMYVRPPQRKPQGGRNKASQHQWSLLAPTNGGTFALVCRVLSARRVRVDGLTFEPDQVLSALTSLDSGFKAKVRYFALPSDDGIGIEDQSVNQAACVVIPTAWLFAADAEGGE